MMQKHKHSLLRCQNLMVLTQNKLKGEGGRYKDISRFQIAPLNEKNKTKKNS